MKRPIGAMIIAIIMMLRSFWGILTGLIALGIGGVALFAVGFAPGSLTIIWGIAAIVIALIGLVLAWGLFSIRPWAWMWTIIILVIGLGFDFLTGEGLFKWIGIIVNIIILIYVVSIRPIYLEQS